MTSNTIASLTKNNVRSLNQKNDAPPRLKPRGLLSLTAVKNRRFLMRRGLQRRSFFGCSGSDRTINGAVFIGPRHKNNQPSLVAEMYRHWMTKYFSATENIKDFRVRMTHEVVIVLGHIDQPRGYVFSEKIDFRLPGECPLPTEDYLTLANKVKAEYARIPRRTVSGFFIDEQERLAGFSWRDE